LKIQLELGISPISSVASWLGSLSPHLEDLRDDLEQGQIQLELFAEGVLSSSLIHLTAAILQSGTPIPLEYPLLDLGYVWFILCRWSRIKALSIDGMSG
jgi:hypothetical protein